MSPDAVARGVIGELFFVLEEPILIWDDGAVLAWNPAAERHFGVLAADAVGVDGVLDRVFADSALLYAALAGEGSTTLDCRSAGGSIWQVTVSGFAGAQGQVVAVFRDVTAARRWSGALEGLNGVARQLLGASSPEELFDAVAEVAHDLLDAEFTAVVVLTPGSETDIGHFSFHAPRELFPARLPRAVGLLAVPLQSGAPARLDDIRGHPAGVGIPVEHPPIGPLVAVPIMSGSTAVGLVAAADRPGVRVFDDVDEAILTELAAHAGLAMAISQARSAQLNAQRTRQEFTRLALHNLRTPLAVATGSALTLRRRYDDLTEPLREEMFDALIRSLERVERLAEESVLAGAELGGHEQRIEAALPRVLIERSLQSHEDLALQQQVTLVMSGDGTESAQPVRLDQKLLDVVLDNLVSNALKHSPPGGTVTVTWRCDDERLRIDVTDEGPGVPASEQGRIFEGFYRTSATMDAAIPGAGVGLAGTRRLLESLGGTIGVASQPGTGATFWATLPLAPPD